MIARALSSFPIRGTSAPRDCSLTPFTFTLTGRAENYLNGRADLGDTISRLQAYQEAGADVLYAPGLATREGIAAVVRSVDRPVNALMGLQGVQLSLAELSALGVKRVSVGSSLCRAALGAFLHAAHEMRERGTFTYANAAATSRTIRHFSGVRPTISNRLSVVSARHLKQ